MKLISSALLVVMLALGLQACGGSGGSSASPNRPPTINGTPATQVVAGQAYSFTPQASDPESATLQFSVTNCPAWAVCSSSTGQLSGTPTVANVGTTAGIVISVTDGVNSANLPAFSVQVTSAANRPPTITGTPATQVAAGQAYSFTPQASDPEGATLRFSITNRPAWATFSTSTGQLSGTPAAGNVGTTAGIVISVSDGVNSVNLPAFSVQVTAAANRPPTITGTPATQVVAGQAYSFTPQASDPEGATLQFSITNRPAWATFSTSTGQLSGTPTVGNVGTTAGIVISVSDGVNPVSLPAFSVQVTSPPVAGSATIDWQPPTERTDGSVLSNLASYRIYYGNSPGTYTTTVTVNNPGLTTYVIDNLAPGTWYFVMTAVDRAGLESSRTNPVSKTIN